MSAPFSRKHLSMEGLLREARRVFTQVPDEPGQAIPLVDHLMSGLALGCRNRPLFVVFRVPGFWMPSNLKKRLEPAVWV